MVSFYLLLCLGAYFLSLFRLTLVEALLSFTVFYYDGRLFYFSCRG